MCPPGKWLKESNSTVEDNVCEPCEANEYKTGTNENTACSPKLTECTAGSFMTFAENSEADNTCTKCPYGTFKSGTNNDTECNDWKLCGVGYG
jgi:hypothetical protein